MRLIHRRRCLSLISALVISSRAKGSTQASGMVHGPAARNLELCHRLDWSFGGRRQRGWNLYRRLISVLIGSNAAPGSAEFAQAVSGWQRRTGLTAEGVIDHPTWMAMVATFQARRRAGRRAGSLPPQPSLITAPAEDFWDSARPLELRQIDAATHAAWQRMYRAARQAPELAGMPENRLRIISAYRSPAYQAALRRRSPNSGRAGLAVNSPHFTGRALDLYIGGEPVSTADWNRQLQVETPLYHWLVGNAHHFGFYPYFYEPWHWEYSGGER